MMKKPKVLLLDEPLSAIDPFTRQKLQKEILQLHNTFKTITILVSHEPSEIYKLSTKVAVLKDGKIQKEGLVKEILLKQKGSQKFSLEAEILDIKKIDTVYSVVLAIGQQLNEIVLSPNEAKYLKIGQKVTISTKAFSPNIFSI